MYARGSMTEAEGLEAMLADAAIPQRAKLDRVREHTAAIRALDDAAFVRVVRAIKKRVSSPKLADEVTALLHALSADRATRTIEAPRAEPAAVPWVGSADLDETAHAIEAAIAADPEAQGPYTVLGDYWASSGDPRGELIAIGHALAKNATHKAMRTAWTTWMEEHGRALWGRHLIVERCLKDPDWYMGFLRACEFVPAYSVDPTEALGVILDEPGPGRFVQRLAVSAPSEIAAAVIARRPRPTLRRLAIGNHGAGTGDVSALWPAVTELRELVIEGSGAALGDVRAPRLERFAFDFGYDVAGGQPIEFLAPLLAGEGVPGLRALALTNCIHTDALCDQLVRSPLAAQLEVIDFGHGTMTPAGANVLAAHAARFPRMTRWEFELNYLDEEACARLRSSLPGEVILDDQRDDDGHRHGADWE
jgi:hypothetical protein